MVNYGIRMTQKLPLLLLCLSLFTASVTPSPFFPSSRSPRAGGISQEGAAKNTEVYPLAERSVAQRGYLGAYVRGSQNASESNITIEENVTADGEPRGLQVTIWKNHTKMAYVDDWQTDEEGYFNITFTYSRSHMEECFYWLPIGNITVNVTILSQPEQGLGPLDLLYNASIYARIFNELAITDPETKELPSFEKTPQITARNRLRFDNGTLVERWNLWTNISLFNLTDGSLNDTAIEIVNGTEAITFSPGQLSNGTYSVNSTLWLEHPPNNETLNEAQWIMGEASYLANNRSAGPMVSNASATFTVINASKINVTSVTDPVNRSGEVMHIKGWYLDSRGKPGINGSMQLNLTQESPKTSVHAYNSSQVNASSVQSVNYTINGSGYFNWSVSVNASFLVGRYSIHAKEYLSKHCLLTGLLSFEIKSTLNITSVKLPERVRTGEPFNISGAVVDIADRAPINGSMEVVFNGGDTGEFSSTVEEGNFTALVELTDNVSSPLVNVTVNVTGGFYWSDSRTTTLEAYNFLNATLYLGNNTFNRTYSWLKGEDIVFTGNNTTLWVDPNTTVNVIGTLREDFGRKREGEVTVYLLNATGTLIKEANFPTGHGTELNVTKNGTMKVHFPTFEENVSVSINVRVDSGGNGDEGGDTEENGEGGWPTIPSSLLISIGGLTAVGVAGGIGLLTFGKRQTEVRQSSLDTVLEKLQKELKTGERDDLLRLSKEALALVGQRFETPWQEDWTPREFFQKLLEAKETYSYEKKLKKIYPAYEEALFAGEENWRGKIKIVYHGLKELNERLREKRGRNA